MRQTDSAEDNGYSIAERMKFAGHNNADTFFGSYAPELSTVDGMASYWNRKHRTVHLEGFRGLSLHYHPHMLQSLPAKVECNLENRVEFISINEEIAMLREKLRVIASEDEASPARARREELYWRKRQLVSEELNKWQQIQPRKIALSMEDEAPRVASLPSYFNRIRRLDPPRDRLASVLFLNVPLRSVQGRGALQDMITLCEKNPQVAYRPSLQPENGHCPVPQCARDIDRFVYLPFQISDVLDSCELTDKILRLSSIKIGDRWEHIHRCYKSDLERQYGFAELCFQCDEWIISADKWFEHCQNHLSDLETLPVQCNPLVFRRTLATAGQCLFCLFDLKLSPTKRFHQFLIKQSWKEHLQQHFWHLKNDYDKSMKTGESNAVPCPDPRCALSFDSIQDYQCHCQDVHCIERIKLDLTKKRCLTRQSSLHVKAFSGSSDKLEDHFSLNGKDSFKHVNETVKLLMLEPFDVITPTESVGLKDASSNYCLSSASPSNSCFSLPIDPRLLSESEG